MAVPVHNGQALASRRPQGPRHYVAVAAAVDGARSDRRRAERALKDGPLTPAEAELLLAKAAAKAACRRCGCGSSSARRVTPSGGVMMPAS